MLKTSERHFTEVNLTQCCHFPDEETLNSPVQSVSYLLHALFSDCWAKAQLPCFPARGSSYQTRHSFQLLIPDYCPGLCGPTLVSR